MLILKVPQLVCFDVKMSSWHYQPQVFFSRVTLIAVMQVHCLDWRRLRAGACVLGRWGEDGRERPGQECESGSCLAYSLNSTIRKASLSSTLFRPGSACRAQQMQIWDPSRVKRRDWMDPLHPIKEHGKDKYGQAPARTYRCHTILPCDVVKTDQSTFLLKQHYQVSLNLVHCQKDFYL